jgi:hypothetical protein
MSLLTKIQTVQFEPDWSKAPDSVVSAVAHLAWIDEDGYLLPGYEITTFERPVTPHPLAQLEQPITAREMYQRGYAAAERGLKREPLSEGELNSLYYQATNQTLREQDTRLAFGFARLIEEAHGITGEIK